MYMMYVDESGDPGSKEGSSSHYILSGLIFSYKNWYKYLDLLKRMRKYFSDTYELGRYTEIHAAELTRIKNMIEYRKIKKYNRIKILEEYSKYIPLIFKEAKIINVCIQKSEHPQVEDFCLFSYRRLISRYDLFLKRTVKDEGMIFCDESNEKSLRSLLRTMRYYNPVKSHYTGNIYNAKISRVIEDMVHRNSATSYFIQTVDVIGYLLKSRECVKGAYKKYNLDRFFENLEPILHKVAAPKDFYGIVRN